MHKLKLLLAAILFFSCENVPQYPQGQDDLIEMESVWQYLKAYSIHQDECVSGNNGTCQNRLLDHPFLYATPEEMMNSMYDTLGGHNYTAYCSDCDDGLQSGGITGGTKEQSRVTDEIRYVSYFQVTDSTALIRIQQQFFSKVTYRQFAALLPGIKGKYLIIDLCGNGGGDLDELDSILELFLPANKAYILARERAWDSTAHKYHTVDFRPLTTKRPASPYLIDKKIVVLMDGNTASASEILASALKDARGAILAGDTSYGKAIGQIKLPRRGRRWLQITFLQLKGISAGIYQNIGLAPDVVIKSPTIYSDRQKMLAVVKLLEPGVQLTDLRFNSGLLKAAVTTEPQGYIVRDV
ncbi:MAG TPA: S41 family peptidase, partial [Chitinispirillaceae bacterium]|nr:S41 family peptidase [Chitinispirillaceae bacterium]